MSNWSNRSKNMLHFELCVYSRLFELHNSSAMRGLRMICRKLIIQCSCGKKKCLPWWLFFWWEATLLFIHMKTFFLLQNQKLCQRWRELSQIWHVGKMEAIINMRVKSFTTNLLHKDIFNLTADSWSWVLFFGWELKVPHLNNLMDLGL